MIAAILAAALSLSDLQSVNRAVNREIRPMSDLAQYGVAERWAIDPPSHAGDCEDYALTKMARLADQGVPLADMSIATVKAGREFHAVLIVGEHVLDNRYAQVGRLSDYTIISRVSAKVALFRVKMQEPK